MTRRRPARHTLTRALGRAVSTLTRATVRTGQRAIGNALKDLARRPPAADGDWIAGQALSTAGVRPFHLFRPHGVALTERLPLIVMLHGCGQDDRAFAALTRMNRIAARERFLVLYPRQDTAANPQRCWTWFGTRSGLAHKEMLSVLAAIDQVCLLYPADPARVAVAGMSAGAGLAALLATHYPDRFRAVIMHSGVGPGAANTASEAIAAMRGRRLPVAPEGEAAWPPLLAIHGARDAVVAMACAHDCARLWAEHAGARSTAVSRVQRGSRHAMTLTRYRLRARTVATVCEIDRMGHLWSGGNPAEKHADASGPDASRMVWAFAKKHFETPSPKVRTIRRR